jgi:prepilin-type N-terminal cleavage/methylation domain-containing protein
MNIPQRDQLRRSHSEKAFTLAELMVACAILAIMVVALFGGISFGFSNITIARQNLRATQIVLEKMEIVRMYSWEQVNSNGFVPGAFTAPFFPRLGGAETNGGVTYHGTIEISKVKFDATYEDDVRQVLVRLNWTNKNIPQSVEMSTYISQYGMHRYIY